MGRWRPNLLSDPAARSESNGPDQPSEPPAGSIRHVIIRNVIAHGQGTCLITGHPKSWLDDISLENVKLFISTDPASPYDKSIHAMDFQYAKNLKVKDVEVNWEKPAWEKWQSALYFKDINGLRWTASWRTGQAADKRSCRGSQ